ncbi:MAG: hypothetical protein CMIDDMOC_00139 [Sodalis sp. Fle]|nr:MAG: hypothetical protein CMIDDMOC_00139 [Sodalis sp. Fle]
MKLVFLAFLLMHVYKLGNSQEYFRYRYSEGTRILVNYVNNNLSN